VAYDPARARDAITRLADLLRYTLSSSEEELVTLAQELAIVNDYLELESLRFDERLRVKRDIPAAITRHRIPVMLLQTVVENAIKHGIAELPEGGELGIHAATEGDALTLTVSNPRPPATTGEAAEGIGLKNAAERLKLLFGARGTLDLDLHDPHLAVVRIRVPCDA
jgi:LytS/YehU family sensor histidine kinase